MIVVTAWAGELVLSLQPLACTVCTHYISTGYQLDRAIENIITNWTVQLRQGDLEMELTDGDVTSRECETGWSYCLDMLNTEPRAAVR